LLTFAEQFGDVIGWDTTNRKYVLAHGMTAVDCEHYKHPLPEDVYDTYMQDWRDVRLAKERYADGPVEDTTRVRISPSACDFLFLLKIRFISLKQYFLAL
jgi:hypothetical protein